MHAPKKQVFQGVRRIFPEWVMWVSPERLGPGSPVGVDSGAMVVVNCECGTTGLTNWVGLVSLKLGVTGVVYPDWAVRSLVNPDWWGIVLENPDWGVTVLVNPD